MPCSNSAGLAIRKQSSLDIECQYHLSDEPVFSPIAHSSHASVHEYSKTRRASIYGLRRHLTWSVCPSSRS